MTEESAVLGVGVLGCADIALRRGIPALLTTPGVRLAAVASRDGAKARTFAERFHCDAVEGYDALLARTDIDAVYIPLPSGLHAEWADKALRAGKHVLAEKPLTTSAEATAALVTTARERGLLLMENFMFVRHPLHGEVRRLVAEGAIGAPRAFHAAFTIPRRPDDDIRYQAALGGGALLDVAGYPLRAARLLLDGPPAVMGAVLAHDPARGVDVGGAALLRTPGGTVAQLTFGLDNAYQCAYEVWGSEGVIRVDRAFTPPPGHTPVIRIERGGEAEELRLPAADQFALAMRCFAATALSGDGFEDHAQDALRQAELVDEIRRMASAGRSTAGSPGVAGLSAN
ncbi:putative dehydrogenase [Streptomyces griseochromogenes]|uniref:Dehydrogenase n=1 Tax=Streptomyces griseochromogenes TaxID=68214 RepID=A0A1B1BB68_9ACTN|nr:Gfo/Idh/MocA family oxidoreductase [Streptomyces griseochromogenes]ANP56031.1 hypothetical protein AVL59_46220 [Streptomyces griseochromogenes]MBP2051118.1 putative dehydrogenase [Streptomyces griseochromogenes]